MQLSSNFHLQSDHQNEKREKKILCLVLYTFSVDRYFKLFRQDLCRTFRNLTSNSSKP